LTNVEPLRHPLQCSRDLMSRDATTRDMKFTDSTSTELVVSVIAYSRLLLVSVIA
jgi:hypothetical protein